MASNPSGWTGGSQTQGSPLKMSLTERRELMAALTQLETTPKHLASREHPRTPLPEGYSVAALIQQPGGASQQCVLAVRDVSNSGLAFLHHHYLSVGTHLHLVFVGPDRQPLIRAQAQVMRCVHARGMAHDVGAKFAQAVNILEMLGIESGSPAHDGAKALAGPGGTLGAGAGEDLASELLAKLRACEDPALRKRALAAALRVLGERGAADGGAEAHARAGISEA
jgi:hypothetical protein